MTDIINSALEMSHQLDDDLSKARDSLKAIDEGIKSLTGRSAMEFSRFNRGGGRGGGPQRVSYSTYPPREQFEGSFRSQGEFAGSKRRFSSFGAGRGDEMEMDNWKRPRMSFDFQEANYGYQPDPFDDDGRGPKPTLSSSVTVTQKDLKSRDEAIAELKTNEKRDVAVRNRRMFGVLMGTLQKFKKDEDSKSFFKEQEKRQKEIENKLEEAKRKEHIELQKEKEKLLEKRRRQQAELRRLQRKKALIAATENQMAQLKRLQNFIQTNSKPPIFYMPTKHTIRTIELQKKSQKRLEEMIKRKQEEMEQELKLIDEFNVKYESDEEQPAGHDDSQVDVQEEGQITVEEEEMAKKKQEETEHELKLADEFVDKFEFDLEQTAAHDAQVVDVNKEQNEIVVEEQDETNVVDKEQENEEVTEGVAIDS